MNDMLKDLSGDIHDIEYIFSPLTIRKKALEIFNLSLANKTFFQVNSDKLDEVSTFVSSVTLDNYPNLNIPFHSRWNHFNVGHFDRLSELKLVLKDLTTYQITKSKIDLVIISVLLDAGAGSRWKYFEKSTGKEYSRSEGLAVASLRLFLSGFFSLDQDKPYQVHAEKLRQLTLEELANGLQVSEKNFLIGLDGRLKLLQNLGETLLKDPEMFGADKPRIGNILDYLQEKFPTGHMTATQILRTIQRGLGSIWPGRISINKINLGDVWSYPLLGDGIESLVPFHKLSQWLSYSLFEPLMEAGFTIGQIDNLTGLAEYRNGGLMLDSGLISLKNKDDLDKLHHPGSPIIVEWRALTIVLLDEIAKKVTENLGKKSTEFPLARVLEGGTWWAGRKIAAQLRKDGSPPIKIDSDGTVF
ncbi:URC4/urg3 family protein [Pigmentibacter ruber]|uniref:URC4/urg3 family protein n=1 Tax=Pigmentibacter ruber TaxID=2683196 RepID=UPI00192E5A3F|nr:URC4/urg3 family protein [Pigmentibacter ruber]BFD31965.1 URC4/urg3 family protein [Pigmentibacter ruber]